MNKEERLALKVVKKGFTVEEWETFKEEIKKNELVLAQLAKNLENAKLEKIEDLSEKYPFVLKHFPSDVQTKLATSDNLRYLRDDLQMRFIEENDKIIKHASEAVQTKFVTLNPPKLSFQEISFSITQSAFLPHNYTYYSN